MPRFKEKDMSKAKFSTTEWELIKDAPFWVNAVLAAGDGKFGLFTKRRDAKALNEAISNNKSGNALVKDIIADNSEPAKEIQKAKQADAEQALGRIAALVEQKLGADDLDALNDFLLKVGHDVAASSREGGLGTMSNISAKEEAALKSVAAALRATDADKKARQAVKARESQQSQAKQAAEAKAREDEARQAAEAREREAQAEKEKQAKETASKEAAALAAIEKARKEAEAKRQAEQARKLAEDQARAEAAKQEAEAKAQEEQARKEAEAKSTPRFKEFIAEHTVVAGDNLSFISEKYYGTQANFRLIYEANKDVIGENMNLIRPGQVLKIPKL
jgi:nucleoid-associated protein YgaU